MSQASVFSCDGPSCLDSDDESIDEHSLMEAGWIVLSLIDNEEEGVAHFCSYSCLEDWAAHKGS